MFSKILIICMFAIFAQARIIPIYSEAQIDATNFFASDVQGLSASETDQEFSSASVDDKGQHDDKKGYSGHEEHYAHPKFEFDYAVQDVHTGDHKFHHEVRHGDSVAGSYSLLEPDRTTRIVYYTADKHKGFEVKVEKRGHPKEPEPPTHAEDESFNFDQLQSYEHHH